MHDNRDSAPYAIVVDDNPVILLHVADILEDAGFCVFAAGDSHQALANFADHGDRIRLLFSNVQIPGPIDGFGLARFASENWPSIAIVVSSGNVDASDGAMPQGSIFLAKPFSADDVLDVVSRVLSVKNGDLVTSLRLPVLAG